MDQGSVGEGRRVLAEALKSNPSHKLAAEARGALAILRVSV